MDRYGLDVNPHIGRIPSVETELRIVFEQQYSELLLMAAMDDTKRHNLRFVLFGPLVTKFGGTVNYSKKERRFDFIEYCVRRHAKRFAI